MGAASSSNTLENTLKVAMSSFNKVQQSCVGKGPHDKGVALIQSISLENIHNTTVDLSDWSQIAKIDVDCMLSTQMQNTISADVEEKMAQLANSTVKGWGIGESDANNVQKNFTDLATKISNTINNTCMKQIVETQSLRLKDVSGSYIHITNLHQNQDIVLKCVQNVVSNSESYAKIKQDESQVAKASVIGLDLGELLAILVVLLVVGGLFIYGMTQSGVGGGMTVMGLLIIVGLFVLIAWYAKKNCYILCDKKDTNAADDSDNAPTPAPAPSDHS